MTIRQLVRGKTGAVKRINPYQIQILDRIENGESLCRDGGGWFWVGRAWPHLTTKADGRTCASLIRKSPRWITFGPFDDDRPEPQVPVDYAKLTDAGRTALAEARETAK